MKGYYKEPEMTKETVASAPIEPFSAPVPPKKETENELYDTFFGNDKPIERMIVFFKDQTFKVYTPSR